MRLSGLQKCDKLHVFDIVEEMKRKHFFLLNTISARNKIYEARVNSFCILCVYFTPLLYGRSFFPSITLLGSTSKLNLTLLLPIF